MIHRITNTCFFGNTFTLLSPFFNNIPQGKGKKIACREKKKVPLK